jgi:hypothetical protein
MNGSWWGRAGLVVVLGVALLAVPPVALSVSEQSTVYVHVEGYGPGGSPPSAETVVYTDLDGDTQAVFDAGRTETLGSVDGQRRAAALETFRATPFVEYAGGYHRVRLYPRPAVFTPVGAATVLSIMLGGLLVVYGALVGLSQTWRAFTTPRATIVPVVGVLALFAVPTGVTGGTTALATPLLVTFPPLLGLFLCGSLAKGGYLKSMLALVGTGGVTLLVGLLVAGQPAIVALGLGSVVLIGGVPWFVLGYFLTATTA